MSAGSKRIAVIGYGSAGLVAVKSLQDLPRELREGWSITVFEGREGLGGIWLPEELDPALDCLPMTGLYPKLRTNTPCPVRIILAHKFMRDLMLSLLRIC